MTCRSSCQRSLSWSSISGPRRLWASTCHYIFNRSQTSLSNRPHQCPLLALSGHAELRCTCPLLGVKRTWRFALHMSAFDPKRTLGSQTAVVSNRCIRCRRPEALGADMRRREFITLLGGAAAAWPVTARAQQAERMRRIGVLMNTAADDEKVRPGSRRFKKTCKNWVGAVGQNVQIDTRWGENNADLIEIRGGISRARAGRHTGEWQPECRGVATCHPHRADCLRERRRSGRRRLCR